MQTTPFQKLIDSKPKYEVTMRRLELKPTRNRWVGAYELVQQLEETRVGDTVDKLDPKLLGKMRFALTDISNLEMILEQFKDDQTPLFKKKFEEMLSGPHDQTKENTANNGPRNTQLELMLCARFREVGLTAELCDPHPDIMVSVNGRKYGFECKRVYSTDPNSIEANVKRAIAQLNDYYLDEDFTKRGMPLLCIDRHITGGDKVLDAKDEEISRSRLDYEIDQFVLTHRRHWAGLQKVKREQIVGVMIYMNVTTLLKTEAMQVVSRQAGANNSGWTMWGKQMFREFVDDIGKHLGPTTFMEHD